jgi:hypothetical protein
MALGNRNRDGSASRRASNSASHITHPTSHQLSPRFGKTTQSQEKKLAKVKSERLRYLGPVSSFSVVTPSSNDTEPKSDDRPLVTGRSYDDLPMDHPVIINLIAGKLLIPAPDDAATEAPPKTTVADSTTNKSGDDRSTSAATQEGKAK